MTARSHNQRALFSLTLLLALFLAIADLLLVWMLRQELLDEFRADAQAELKYFGQHAVEDLLRGNYARVEDTVLAWGERHPAVISFTAQLPNDFQLGYFERPYFKSAEPLRFTDTVGFQDRELLRLTMVKDVAKVTKRLLHHAAGLILVSILLVVALGILLWRFFQRSAIVPLEQEIERANSAQRELTEVNDELESFSYSVSHDLRAPLNVIQGFSQILSDDYSERLGDQGVTHVRRIISGCKRMGALITHLLRLSRVSSAELVPQTVNLSALAESVLEALWERDPGRQVKIDILPEMRDRGDPFLLRIMLENLLGNAWKYTAKHESPRIAFSRSSSGTETVYRIEDNGVGFDMKYADQLFTAFKRLHGPSEFEGSGVGLATVQRVVHRHKGRVWAQGEVDGGASFYFTLGVVP